MTDIVKPPFDIRGEEDSFLIPPGQQGSYVDAFATTLRTVTAIHIHIGNDTVVLVILEAP